MASETVHLRRNINEGMQAAIAIHLLFFVMNGIPVLAIYLLNPTLTKKSD